MQGNIRDKDHPCTLIDIPASKQTASIPVFSYHLSQPNPRAQSWWSAAARAALTSAQSVTFSVCQSREHRVYFHHHPLLTAVLSMARDSLLWLHSFLWNAESGIYSCFVFIFFFLYSWRELSVMEGLMEISTVPCTVMPPAYGNQSRNYLSNHRSLSLIVFL